MRRLIAVLALSACSYVAPTTAAKLATVDPLTADPAQIEVAVLFPPGLQATPDTAKLQVKAAGGRDQLDGTFTLAEHGTGPGPKAKAGSQMVIYGITPADAAQMRDWQSQVARWNADGAGKSTGSLGVAIEACTVNGGPAEDAEGSVLIRLEKAGDFLPLIHAAPLSHLLGAEIMAAIKPCNNPD